MRGSKVIAALASLAAVILGTACGPSSSPSKSLSPTAPTISVKNEIEGRVVLRDAGDSSGIQVFIPGTSLVAMTDADGGFVISGLEAGHFSVMAQQQNYITAKLGELDIPASEKGRRYVLPSALLQPVAVPPTNSAEARFGSIRGHIRVGENPDSANPPDLSQARVELEGTAMKTIADVKGDFFLWSVKPGKYRLIVQGKGFALKRAEVEVAASDKPTEVEISLDEQSVERGARTIHGALELFYADGSVSNDFDLIAVGLRELPERKVAIEPDGTFTIGGLAAQSYTVFSVGDGYENSADAEADLTQEPSTQVKLTLKASSAKKQKGGSIVGVARKNSEAEKDMSGISVAVTGTSLAAVTDTDGHYRIADVPVGLHDLIAKADGYEQAKAEGVQVNVTEEVQAEEIVLEPIRDYPVVIETDPAEGARDVVVRPQMRIDVRFSKKMKPESLKGSVKIEPSADFKVYAAREHPDSDYDFMVILVDGASRNQPVKFDGAYRLTISEKAEDFEGLHLQESFTLHFRTGKAAITDTAPADGEEQVTLSPAQPLVIRFNAPIAPDSLNARDIQIRPSVGGTPTVHLSNDVATGWSSLQIQSFWKPDTRYEVIIPRRLRTTGGQMISNTPYTIKFRTQRQAEFKRFEQRAIRR